MRALVAGDVELARTFHHPDFQLITPRGFALTREAYLGDIASGGLRYLRWEPGEMSVRQSGDSAVIRYRAELEMLSDGEKLPVFHCWHIDIYERRDGRWMVLWSQATFIHPGAASA